MAECLHVISDELHDKLHSLHQLLVALESQVEIHPSTHILGEPRRNSLHLRYRLAVLSWELKSAHGVHAVSLRTAHTSYTVIWGVRFAIGM